MVASDPIKTKNMTGVRFEFNSKEYEVMFSTGEEAGGKISIIQDGKIIRDEVFTNKVKPQVGLF